MQKSQKDIAVSDMMQKPVNLVLSYWETDIIFTARQTNVFIYYCYLYDYWNYYKCTSLILKSNI